MPNGTQDGHQKGKRKVVLRPGSSDALLAAIVDSSDDAIISKDLDGTITSWNKGAEKLFGYSADEALGQHISLIIPRDLLQEEDRILASIRRGERIDHYETRRKHRDGHLIEVSLTISPVQDDAGHVIGASKVARNITFEKQQRELRSLLAAVVDSSDDAIITKDLSSTITSWNKGAERLFGYKAEEVIGRPIWLLFPPDRIAEEAQILESIKRGERVNHFETIRMHKDGRLLEISLTISPIKDANGHVIGASKIARDISQRKRSERAVELARLELEHANQQLRQLTGNLEARVIEKTSQVEENRLDWQAFAYSVSHDLRSPLRALASFAGILKQSDATLTDEQRNDFLQRIETAAGRMLSMLDGVLDFTKVAQADLQLRPINLDQSVSDIINATPELRAPAARVRVESPLGHVLADPAGLQQCLSNLLSNAMKYIAAGNIPEIVICSKPGPEFVRLWVEDNGIGIPEEEQGNLFQMFRRSSNARNYAGTGLGLAIVRRAAERMGGRVGVESTIGQGSSFWLDLRKAP
jgi:PAS domain S-box-containing protein